MKSWSTSATKDSSLQKPSCISLARAAAPCKAELEGLPMSSQLRTEALNAPWPQIEGLNAQLLNIHFVHSLEK